MQDPDKPKDRNLEESLSALVDGELDSDVGRGLLRRLGTDDGLSRCWAEYHLIGDTLRGTCVPSLEFPRFRAALESEPTVFSPWSARVAASMPVRRVLSVGTAAVAVALVGWMAWPMLQDGPLQRLASGVGAVQTAAAVIPSARGVGDYLLAHQRFSPSFAMQGAAPYVRLVDDDTAKAKR